RIGYDAAAHIERPRRVHGADRPRGDFTTRLEPILERHLLRGEVRPHRLPGMQGREHGLVPNRERERLARGLDRRRGGPGPAIDGGDLAARISARWLELLRSVNRAE